MALKIGTVEPTAIKVVQSGTTTDLTILKATQNGTTTAVWGKPFSLTYTAGSNSKITVNRTSSPNQHASTGSLSSGAKIYYGDVLSISGEVTSTAYRLTTFNINGTNYGSEETLSASQTVTVTSAVVVTTATTQSKSWHTKFTGSKTTTFEYLLTNDLSTGTQVTQGSDTTAIALSNYNVTLNATDNPIRITGTLVAYIGSTSNTATLTGKQLSTSFTTIASASKGAGTYASSTTVYLRAQSTNIEMDITVNKHAKMNSAKGKAELTITKVEQYY